MIVFGTRMYGKKNIVNGWGFCDNCGVYGKNKSYDGRKWGHLYFIPLIPEGPRVRVLKECKKCSHGLHIPVNEILNIHSNLHDATTNALDALIAGRNEYSDNGTNLSATSSLVDSVEMLLCLQSDSHLLSIISALRENGLMYQYYLLEGESLEFHGKLDEAMAAYQQAVQSDRSGHHALMSLGSIYLKKKDHQNARDNYERALKLTNDRFPVLQVLLNIYTTLKDHTRLAQTYEECFSIFPELADDKKIFKAYKKACNKAGLQPMKE